MTHIALVGPGAIGGTIATSLSQNSSHTVWVAARTPFDSLEVETRQGVIRASPRERILPVTIDCPAERSGPGRIRQRGFT